MSESKYDIDVFVRILAFCIPDTYIKQDAAMNMKYNTRVKKKTNRMNKIAHSNDGFVTVSF